MSTVQRIAKNTAVLIAGQAVTFLLAFFYNMIAARHLGAAGFGILSFGVAFTAIFGIFADFGLQLLTVREVARDRSLASKYVANVCLMKTVLAAATFGLIAVVINALGYPWETIKVVYLIGLSVIAMSFIQVCYSIFQAHERMEFQSIGQILSSVIMLSGAVVATRFGLGAVGFAWLYLLSGCTVLLYAVAVFGLLFAKPSAGWVSDRLRIDAAFWKPMIRAAFPFFLAGTFTIIAFRVDMVMLSALRGDADVGWYSAAYKLVEAVGFIPLALGGATYPILSRLYVSSQDLFGFAYRKSLEYLFLIGLPIATGATIVADKIIASIYLEGFGESARVLQILVWAVPFTFAALASSVALMGADRQSSLMRVLFVSMLTNVVLNAFLIPRYSYVGASAATVATAALQSVLCAYMVWRSVAKVAVRGPVLKAMLGSGIMALFAVLCRDMYVFLLIPLAATVYLAALAAMRTFTREDLDLLRQLRGGGRER